MVPPSIRRTYRGRAGAFPCEQRCEECITAKTILQAVSFGFWVTF